MKRTTAAAAALACVLPVGVALQARASGPGTAAAAPLVDAAPQRLAFTRDRAQLHQVQVFRYGDMGVYIGRRGPARTLLGAGHGQLPTHAGEAATALPGIPGQERTAFVATPEQPEEDADAPFGEVHELADGEYRRITCNRALETHPVPRPDSADGRDMIAFASDRAGTWDIWVAYREPEPEPEPEPEMPVPGIVPGAHLPAGCDEDIVLENVTGTLFGRSDELWPAWGPGGELVFSATRENPLGDLFTMYPDLGAEPEEQPAWGPERRLTEAGGAAAGQPAVTRLTNGTDCDGSECEEYVDECDTGRPMEAWIAFTTTQFRPDGSLGLVRLPGPDEPLGPVVDPWRHRTTPLQSSEPAWSGCGENVSLAFTATDEDPLGDVAIADVENPDRADPPDVGLLAHDDEPSLSSFVATIGEPGTAESHPTWTDPFTRGAPDAQVMFTSDSPPNDALPESDRVTDADLADVRASDGGDQRVVVDRSTGGKEPARFDEAGASYSPDGTSIVYGAAVRPRPTDCGLTYRAAPETELPDYYEEPVTSTIDVADDQAVTDVDLFLDLEHESTDHLELGLVHGTSSVRLASGRGSYTQSPGGYVRTWFDDEADLPILDGADTFADLTMRPEQRLAAFDHDTSRGPWTLTISDEVDGGAGVLRSWALRIESCDVPDPAGRELRTAAADGTGDESLAGITAHGELDVDLDPAFSPDGDRVAFVRYRADESDGLFYEDPEVMVTDLTAGTPNATTVSVPGDDGCEYVSDVDPTWSPDGEWLLVSRASEDYCDTDSLGARSARSARGAPRWIPGDRRLTAVRADGSGGAVDLAVDAACEVEEDCLVPGRSPAWSVDGTRVAFEDRGALRLVGLDPDALEGAGDVLVVDTVDAVTGFEDSGDGLPFDQRGAPTPSRPVISVARDPVWSPDGAEIAFTGQPAGQPDQRGIWAVAPDGTGLRLVTDLFPDDPERNVDARGPDTQPAWQPSPSDLAVTVEVTPPAVGVDEPAVATYRIRNLGPARDEDVVLTTDITPGGTVAAVSPPAGCAADGSGCTLAGLDAEGLVVYPVALSYPTELEATVAGEVSTPTWSGRDPDPANDTDAGTLTVADDVTDLAVTLTLDEPVGYVGGERTATITVDNVGGATAEDVVLTSSYDLAGLEPTSGDLPCLADGEPCELGQLGPDDEPLELEVVLATKGEGTGSIKASVSTATSDADPANDEATADLEVLQPTVRLLPEVARPGSVVLAYAEDMPPSSTVTLTWDTGITVVRRPYTVRGDGTVRVSMLIVRRDQVGERALVAHSEEELFSDVDGRMLVTLRVLMAPGFNGRG